MPRHILLQESFKLALSMTLFYWLALWLDWDMPKYGGLAIALIALGTTGASFHKGLMRLVGTTVGLGVGLLGLALFAQDRWLMLLALSSWLVVVSYFMPVSRYGYAWYVAGFLPPLVWSTTYGDVDNAFHYASFRYLETCVGIVIYTVVSALLWPRSAGDALGQLGGDLAAKQRDLWGLYRRQLSEGELPTAARQLQSGLTAATSKLTATLQAAYTDTPSVIAAKKTWEVLRLNSRALVDALALWGETIDDARELELGRHLPGLEDALEALQQRFERIADLWHRGDELPDDSAAADAGLLMRASPALDREVVAELTHLERAALLGFVRQLEIVDVTSREVLATLRVLAGLADARDHRPSALPPDLYRPPTWDPSRLVSALSPALCFTVGFLLWIFTDPPTGPSVPMMAATLALMLMTTPANALNLVWSMFVIIWVAVAPVYLFVMPWLDSGFGLLVTIFVYTAAAGLIGGRKPLVKTLMLVLFTMMTGISNDQSYSFLGLVNGGMMYLLAGSSIALVQLLLTPSRPEHLLRSGVQRFFRRCAAITGELGTGKSLEHERALRKRYYESMVMPVPGQLQVAAGKLDYRLHPDNGADKVQQLVSDLQSIAHRLQALELAHDLVARRESRWSEPLARLTTRLRESVQHVFVAGSRLQAVDADRERANLAELTEDLSGKLDVSMAASPELLDDEALADLYAVLGCARGLVRATVDAAVAMKRINWETWAQARF